MSQTVKKIFIYLVILGFVPDATAQISAPIRPDPIYKNAISVGPSIGTKYRTESFFFGASATYSRTLTADWSLAFAIAWDKEITELENGGTKHVDSFTFISTVTYGFTQHLSLTTGLGKGFADNDNPSRSLGFVNGSWATGVSLGLALPDLPFMARDSLVLSGSWEYDITEREPSVSVDLGWGIGF